MTSLFRRWPDVRRALKQPDRVLWLFDFDGTLAPIARHPRHAALTPGVRRLLKELAARFPGHVGILSGRPQAQIRRKVGIAGLLYGGTHGFEIQGPHFRWKHALSATRQKRLRVLALTIRRLAATLPGLWLENKRWTLCVHYRAVRSKDRERRDAILQKISNRARHLGFKLQSGLKVLEILSDTHWDKGRAVQWLKKHCRVTEVFYAGDDVTDETVFRTAGATAVTVRIGPSKASQARYYLKHQSDSERLLKSILGLK